MAKSQAAVDPSFSKPGRTLLDKAAEVEVRDGPRRAIHDEIYQLYFNDHKLPFPESMPVTEAGKVYSSMAAEIWDRVDGLFSGAPEFTVYPDGIARSALKSALEIQDWLNSWWIQSERGAGKPTWDLMRRDALGLGIGGGFIFKDPRPWKDMPKAYVADEGEGASEQDSKRKASMADIKEYKTQQRLPIIMRHAPGTTLHPIYDDDGLREVYEIFWDTALNVLERYPKSEFARKTEETDIRLMRQYVPVLRHANRRYCTVGIIAPSAIRETTPTGLSPGYDAPEILMQWDHGLNGDVPYVIIHGYVTGVNQPGRDSFGVLYHLRPAIRYLDTLLSQRAAGIRMWAWPTPVLERALNVPLVDKLGPNGRPLPFEMPEGQLVQLLPGEKLTFLVVPEGPEIEQQVATIMRFIDRLGLASVTYGQTAGDASSGYAVNTLLQAAKGKMLPLEKHLRQGAERAALLALKTVQAINSDVYVFDRTGERPGYLGLSASDIGDKIPEIEAKVQAEIEQDMPAKASTANQLMQLGVWDDVAAMNYVGVKDTVKMQDRVMVYKTRTSQEMEQFIIQQAQQRVVKSQQKPAQPSPEDMAARTPALEAAIGQLSTENPLMPGLVSGMSEGGMQPGAVGGIQSIPGGPNLGIPTGVNVAPNPPPPNAGAALGGPSASTAPLPPPPAVPRRGGRGSGASRRPGGPKGGGRPQ